MLIGQVMLEIEKTPQVEASSPETTLFPILAKNIIVFTCPLLKLDELLLKGVVPKSYG